MYFCEASHATPTVANGRAKGGHLSYERQTPPLERAISSKG